MNYIRGLPEGHGGKPEGWHIGDGGGGCVGDDGTGFIDEGFLITKGIIRD